MKTGNRKAALTGLILSAAVLLCAGILIYQANASSLHRLATSRDAKRRELRGLQVKLSSRPVLERKYQGLQEQLAILEPTLATYAYVPTFLRQIEKLAQDTKNNVAGVKPLPLIARTPAPPPAEGESGTAANEGKSKAAAPKKPYDSVPIEFNLTGDYWQMVAFLKQLSSFPKMLAVEDVSMTPEVQAQGLTAPNLRVKMTLLALIQKGEEKWTSDAKRSSS